MFNILLDALMSLNIATILLLSEIVFVFLGVSAIVWYEFLKISMHVKFRFTGPEDALRNMVLNLLAVLFFNRIVSTIIALVTYPVRGWATNIVYNYLLHKDYEFHDLAIRNPKKHNLASRAFKNGFYGLDRMCNPILLGNEYRKNKIGLIGYKYNIFTALFFPVAMFIWFFHNDKNPYYMAAIDRKTNGDIFMGHKLKWIPFFIRKHCNVLEIANHYGPFLDVGEKQIKERAMVSFILGRLFLDEIDDINFKTYFNI